MISQEEIASFQRDGVVVLRGVFDGWVDEMAAGIDRNMADPGPYASENSVSEGRFFDDYCNWTRIPEFERVCATVPQRNWPRNQWFPRLPSSSTIMCW